MSRIHILFCAVNILYVSMGNTASAMDIYCAIQDGQVMRVQELISASPHLINCQDSSGFSILHCAIANKQQEIADFLIERGADVDITDSTRQTPLHYAIDTNQPYIVSKLLEARANVNICNIFGESPAVVHRPQSKQPKEALEILAKFPQRLTENTHSVALTLAMSTHERLGSESPMNLLPQFLLHSISKIVKKNCTQYTINDPQHYQCTIL